MFRIITVFVFYGSGYPAENFHLNPDRAFFLALPEIKHLKSNQKEECTKLPTTYICHFLFHITVLRPTVHTVQNSRPKLRNKICSFFFCWIRNNNSGSVSRQKFRIHADPEHCLNLLKKKISSPWSQLPRRIISDFYACNRPFSEVTNLIFCRKLLLYK